MALAPEPTATVFKGVASKINDYQDFLVENHVEAKHIIYIYMYIYIYIYRERERYIERERER